MIELKNLTKIYKGKGNSSVKALDDVSFVLPEKGLVFILGKSGCGKSTLLNLMGGLDRPTSGEIVIKGRSSKSFSASDFDSYRNTYLGFIFQEYNVLPEFSVAENVTLATELQGKKADKGALEDILEEVELSGLEERKPTTLSGGQKQRVAIARALVKDPQIIMADEPTGALDSNTGKAVLDLLKRLSHDKLVVVVSHDREFANKYADRIIELSDGRILSDLSFVRSAGKEDSDLTVVGDDVHISKELDAAMLVELNALLKDKKKLTLTLEEGGVSVEGGYFAPTKPEDIPVSSEEGGKLIRSKFPLKYAFRMGASGLRTKRFRLVLTIILSTVALTAFGFMLALMAFDADKTLQNALEEGGQTEIGVAYYETHTQKIPVLNIDYSYSSKLYADNENIRDLQNKTGLEFLRVQCFSNGLYGYQTTFSFCDEYDNYPVSYRLYDPQFFCGFARADKEQIERFGGKLIAGRMPEASNEILISDQIARTIYNSYFRYNAGGNSKSMMKSEEDYPVGKSIKVGGSPVPYTICGVFSAPAPDKKFDELINIWTAVKESGLFSLKDSDDRALKRLYALQDELETQYRASLSTVCFVDDSFFEANGSFLGGGYGWYNSVHCEDPYFYTSISPIAAAGEASLVKTFDDQTLESGQYLISEFALQNLIGVYRSKGSLDDEQMKEISQKTDLLYEVNEEGKSEILFDVLTTLRNADPSAFDGSMTFFSDYGGKKALSCVGVIVTYDKQDIIYVTEEDNAAFFPEQEKNRNQEGADFLLTFNTPEARKALTKGKFDVKEGTEKRFDLYGCYQSEKVERYNTIIAEISSILFWVGFVIAVFASLLLFNFISVSINYKKKDIGILRALGARKVDVFKVFFSESMIIIGICYVLSVVLAAVLLIFFNKELKEDFLVSTTLFFFGPLQALILGGLATAVAFISTILPVVHHAKKPPVDAIRAL